MKGKGLVRIFLVALILVCLYQLLFTFVTWRVEESAKDKTNNNPVLTERYLDSIAEETCLNLGFTKFSYRQCKENQINLGLDLQGGMNVVMEVSVPDVIRGLSDYTKDSDFNKAMELAVKDQENSQTDFVTLFSQAYQKVNPNGKLANIFATRENQGRLTFNSSNAEVVAFLREEAEKAIDRSFQILRTRIDKFGVNQPNIQRQQGTGRIIIELPGVDEPTRVRKLLQGTAQLEFWETYEFSEIFKNVETLNTSLAARQKSSKNSSALDSLKKNTADTATLAATANTDTAATDTNSLAGKLAKKEATNDTAKGKDSASKAQAKSAEQFKKENPIFSLLVPNADPNNGKLGKGPLVGYAQYKDTAALNAYFNSDLARGIFPRDLKLLWSAKSLEDNKSVFALVAIKTQKSSNRPPLDGDVITRAYRNVDQYGQVEVTMAMNAEGARKWKTLTGANIDRSVAIVLDNMVYSYPTVRSEIAGGISSISGNFTVNEAADLANILEAGKLPAPAKIIEEAIVGPSLGQESIQSGTLSAIAGLLAVAFFMILYYGSAGFVANIALLANIFFIFGVLASLQAVLTLPGIAGIVLTMGMAVDANVLIYERIKEELETGRAMKNVIADGFKHAMSAIVDSNVTTLLTAVILFAFGTGPIQGFATTLIIGILTSMFSAIFITRLILDARVAKGRTIAFSNSFTHNFLRHTNINFLGKRKLFYLISGAIIVAGIVSMFTRGFSMGIDFKGGRSYTVQFEKPQVSVDLRAALEKGFEAAPEVKTFGGDNTFKITTTYLINDKTEEADLKVEQLLFDGLKQYLPANLTLEQFKEKNILSSQKVGPTIVDDIKQSAVYSVIFAIIGIATYILLRFRNWQYSLGAALSLLHDVLIMMASFTLLHGILPFSLEVDQHFIAALLTIVGYSINDTVVVYDRLREELNLHHGASTEKIINDAVNKTLSRTIMTAFTVILTVLIIFIFGGDVIRGFSFALLVGLLVGTYSSVFVASSVVVDLLPKKND